MNKKNRHVLEYNNGISFNHIDVSLFYLYKKIKGSKEQ